MELWDEETKETQNPERQKSKTSKFVTAIIESTNTSKCIKSKTLRI